MSRVGVPPYENDDISLAVRAATRKPRELRLPAAPAERTDSVGMLLEDRAARSFGIEVRGV